MWRMMCWPPPCFAAVLGGLNFRQYRIAVPLAAICWFAPGFDGV